MIKTGGLIRFLLPAIPLLTLAGCGGSGDSADKAQSDAILSITAYEDRLQLCESCHGKDGADAASGAPFIAGQPFPVLKQALQSYLNTNRAHAGMREALYAITLNDVEKLASHYSELQTPWNPKAPVMEPKRPVSPKAIAAGKAISTPCAGCHGPDGNSDRPGVPNLAGVEGPYLVSALNSYLNDRRKDAIMINFRHSLSQQDISNLIAFYSSQKRRQSNVPVTGTKAMIQAGEKAARACIGCHGVGGNSFNATYPSLAGQNEPYLKLAISAYASGHRKDDLMNEAVKGLSEKTIANLAAYFASQKTQPKQSKKATTTDTFAPLAQGTELASTCNGCHGDGGNSRTAGIPSLAGLPQDYLASAIRAYRDKTRRHVLMNNLAENLSDADAERLALYYVTQEPVPRQKAAGEPAMDIKEMVDGCNGCHGENGRSTDGAKPSLAGQNAKYLVAALEGYALGKRDNKTMKDAIAELNTQQMKALAQFYAAQAPLKPEVRMPSAPEKVVEKCQHCHGEGGWSEQPDKPRLARQQESYLVDAMLAYKNKTREHTIMNAMLEVLSRMEIDALAAYYSKQAPQTAAQQ